MAIMTDQTAASIALAKQHQAEERQRVFARTGLRITDVPYRIHCSQVGCQFVASAQSEGRAVRSLAAHLVSVHMQEGR